MIYYFNPGHETAVLNKSKYYMAPANVVAMQKELAFLPAWYGDPPGYVFVENELPEIFEQFVADNLGICMKAVTRDYILQNRGEFIGQKVDLWGLSPQSIYLFETLSAENQLDLIIPEWKDEYVPLCSRLTTRNCLQFLISHTDKIRDDIIPAFYTSLDEIENEVSRSKKQLLAKAPYSSSGRGLLWLPVEKLTRTERQILHGHLKKQGMVSLERVLDKKLDFAMEFTLGKDNVVYEGLSLFETNNKGAYIGNFLGSQQVIESRISEFIGISFVSEIKDIIAGFLLKHICPSYSGRVGVDMMIYQEDGQYKLHPCLEINIRNNMGFLAIALSRNIINEKSTGYFYIDFSVKEGEIFERDRQMNMSFPPVFHDSRVRSGYLPLCPVSEKSRYRAYILINE